MSDKDYLIKGEMYQYNLGWLIKELMSFKQDLATAIDLKTIKYADPIQWDITTQYPANTVVVDPKSGTAYMSKVPVPAGVELTNTNYWVVVFNYQDIYNKIMDGVAFNDRDQDYATKDLLVNDLVWYAGDLYRVTRAIPTGSKYIPGTNLVKTTIESLLARYYGRDRTAQVSNDTVNVSGDYTLVAGDIAETASNLTLHSTRDMLLDSDGKLTEQITGDREIDVDGNDSVHIDGASTVNVGGLRTEVYAGDKTEGVTGKYTGKFGSASYESEAPAWKVKFPDKTVDLHDITSGAAMSIKDFGAMGDGVTDDTAVIQEAVNTASALYIPVGTYIVSAPISIPASIEIYGCGLPSMIKVNADFDGFVFTTTDNHHVYFHDFRIYGNDHNANGIKVNLSYEDSILSNMYIDGCKGTLLELGNADGTHLSENCVVSNCTFNATSQSGAWNKPIVRILNQNELRFHGNRLQFASANRQNAVCLEMIGVRTSTFDSNIFYGSLIEGFTLANDPDNSCYGDVFINNIFEKTSTNTDYAFKIIGDNANNITNLYFAGNYIYASSKRKIYFNYINTAMLLGSQYSIVSENSNNIANITNTDTDLGYSSPTGNAELLMRGAEVAIWRSIALMNSDKTSRAHIQHNTGQLNFTLDGTTVSVRPNTLLVDVNGGTLSLRDINGKVWKIGVSAEGQLTVS